MGPASSRRPSTALLKGRTTETGGPFRSISAVRGAVMPGPRRSVFFLALLAAACVPAAIAAAELSSDAPHALGTGLLQYLAPTEPDDVRRHAGRRSAARYTL